MIPSVATVGALLCVSFMFPSIEAQLLRAASLSNAPIGIYSREGGPFGDSAYLASLGGAPVGAYSRHQNPIFLYPIARAPVVLPPQISVDRRPIRPRPRPPVKPPVRRVPTSKVSPKPSGVSGRGFGGLLKGLFG